MMKKAIYSNPAFFYSSMSLNNFRGFKSSGPIPLAPLTFLVGPNSSGKSSIFDATLLLTQSGFFLPELDSLTPNWSGPLVDLGSHRDTVYRQDHTLKIQIALQFAIDMSALPWRTRRVRTPHVVTLRSVHTIAGTKKDQLGRLLSVRIQDPDSSDTLDIRYGTGKVTVRFLDRVSTLSASQFHSRRPIEELLQKELLPRIIRQGFLSTRRRKFWRTALYLLTSMTLPFFMSSSQRVSSGRAAPKRWYPLSDFRFRPTEGLIAPRVFDTVDPTMLDEQSYRQWYFQPPKRSRTRKKLSLSNALRDLEIATKITQSRFSPYHSAISVEDSVTGVTSNLIDVGYGASQVIPILHACLTYAPGPLFIEQPEIHLHPRAQGHLAELLCDASRSRQVVIETHSVHMVNRARILVAQGRLRPEHVVINYVRRTKRGSEVRSIPLLPSGEFAKEWPGGFFDERYEDTMTLLNLRDKDNA
jgi:hypothetical protein